MAIDTDLKELRLKISDPADVIDIIAVANAAALPAVPAAQTAYLVEDVGEYQVYDTASATWSRVDLLVSDSRLLAVIASVGADKAPASAIAYILAAVGQKIGRMKAMSGGAESMEFQSLADTYAFYKNLARTYADQAEAAAGVSSGLYLRTRHGSVGGGMRG